MLDRPDVEGLRDMARDGVPRVLVTGSTGFIGRKVVERFAYEGCPVVAVSRSPAQSLPGGAMPAKVPVISGETQWSHLLRDVQVVIHCAAHVPSMGEHPESTNALYDQVNVEGTRALAVQAAAAGVRRFLFLSSIKVHGELTELGSPFSELSPFAPEDAYGRSKCAAEAALQGVVRMSAMNSVVLRPPLVYGAQVKGNLAVLLRWIRSGLPIPLGAVTGNRRSLIGVENLVDAIWHCTFHPGAASEAFVVSDGQDLSTAEILRTIGKAMERHPCLIPVPTALLRTTAEAVGQADAARRLLGSLEVDSSKIRTAVHWQPPLTMFEGFRRMMLAC